MWEGGGGVLSVEKGANWGLTYFFPFRFPRRTVNKPIRPFQSR